MNLIIFGIISIAIFVIITIIGLFIAMNKKDTSSVHVLAFTENANNLTLVKAIPSPNKYVNFDEILDVVVTEYSKSYKAAGQVYNETK